MNAVNSPALNLIVFATVVILVAVLYGFVAGANKRAFGRRRAAGRIELEDALKRLYNDENAGEAATPSDFGDRLGISPRAAQALGERMRGAGLVTTVDGRLLLTEKGRKYALHVIRAHRLWERHLADETGVHPLKWHVEADRREHALTAEQMDALAERLGNPHFDPHGDPIPTAEGIVPQETTVTLPSLDVGDDARVVHIEDEPQVVYEQLVASDVYPGMELRVDVKTEDRIVIETDGRRLVFAPVVAGNVSVQQITGRKIETEREPLETLSDLKQGEVGEVVRISPTCRGVERRRLMDLGIVPGTSVAYERQAFTGGLTAYRVRGTVVALREKQTDMISIHRKKKVTS